MEGIILFVGTAGSGKSHLTDSFGRWLEEQGYTIARINLDPAVDWIPYSPEVDVRDYVSARSVMDEMKLGPNGALVASIDMLVSHVEALKRDMAQYKVDYYLIDTPGQMELFAYRNTGPLVLESLIGANEASTVFLIDPIFVERPSSLVSALLLAASTFIRLGLPQVNVVSKADLLLPDIVEELFPEMSDEPGILGSLLEKEKSVQPLTSKLADVLDETGFTGRLIPVSSNTQDGFEALYYELQKILKGGEDAIA